MKDVLKFLGENPIWISAPIALLGVYFGVKNWRLSKARIGIDQAKFFQDFTQALDSLKKIYSIAHQMKIKKFDDITIENLKSDAKKLEELVGIVDKYEDRFKNALFTMQSIYLTRNKILQLVDEISNIKEIDYDLKMQFSSKFGFIYMSLFLMEPSRFPKVYTIDEVRRELQSEIFMEQHKNLVWEKY